MVWRKDTNRIYIFTTRHSGGCARRDRSDIYNYPARQSIRSSGTFQNLFLRTPSCMKAASNPSCAYSASSENFSTFPHLQPPPPPSSPLEGPHNARCGSAQTTSGAPSPKVISWGPNLSWPVWLRA